MPTAEDDGFELRLFLEEIVCNLCRFQYLADTRRPAESLRIDQEINLGEEDLFADIRVQAPGGRPYFVEVKYGYPAERMVRSLSRKYGRTLEDKPEKLVLVAEPGHYADWPGIVARLKGMLAAGVELEVWDEARLLGMIKERFGLSLASITAADLLDVRDAIDRAKADYAFGPDHVYDPLEQSLLWHLGFWRLRQLRDSRRSVPASADTFGTGKRSLLPPGLYREVVVLMADLTGFSSYVRDTRDERVVRNCLTSFYAKSRFQILNAGGMLYQFLGDAVIGFFGVPDHAPNYAGDALRCASAISMIGDSVSNEWQRQIDRVQTAGGVHIGMTVGDLQVMSLRPFSRTYMGAVGDPINMAARLNTCAGSGEIVVSNTFYQKLDTSDQIGFEELAAVEARNIGKIRAWKLNLKRGPCGVGLSGEDA